MTIEHTPRTEVAWKIVQQWTDCVQKQDIDSLLPLFCENDNAFWGTFANIIRNTREELRTYYDEFLNCESISCEIVDCTAREMTTDIVSFTGIYAFNIVKNPGDEETRTIARFTFTMSITGMPSVMHTMSGNCASIASKIASAA